MSNCRKVLAVLLGAAIVVLAASCGTNSASTTPVPAPPPPLGYTHCWTETNTGRAVAISWVRSDLDRLNEALVRAHEAEHRRQIEMFDSCEEYVEWLKVPHNRAWGEARAFCATASASLALGISSDPATAVAAMTRRLWTGYPEFGLTARSAADLMRLVCNTGTDTSARDTSQLRF